jgi:MoaA/NifB/PqqE/SkfB family radical SAM enzyme
MDFSLFKKIIDEAKDTLELIYLHLAGEPLLHPKLFEMIKYCKQKRIPAGLSTNATLLNEYFSKELIRAGLDYIILSFDGFTASTYEAIRKGANFHKTLSNIEAFLKLKGPRDRKPFTVIQLVYMEKNKHEMRQFLSFWENRDIDVARLKPFINYPGLDRNLAAIERRPVDIPCFLLWRQLAIYWNGIATACCFDYIGGSPVGDLKNETLREVWNSQPMQEIRERHIRRKGNTINICRGCERPYLNILALAGTTLFDGLALKKILPAIEKRAIKDKISGLGYFPTKE